MSEKHENGPFADEEPEADSTPTARQLQVTDHFLTQIPKVILAPEEVNVSDLDNRDYFLLSLLDGSTTVETLLDICGMPSEEAIALLDGLVRRGIVGFVG